MVNSHSIAVALLTLLLTACGDDPAPSASKHPAPSWARVAPEQIAEMP